MKIFTNIINKKEKQVPAYPYGSEECGKFLKETYKESIPETLILVETYYDKLESYEKIVSSINNLEKEKKAIEHMLQNEIREYETAFCKDKKITWKTVVRNTIDTKKLKADYPEIVNEYMKSSSSRVFKIK